MINNFFGISKESFLHDYFEQRILHIKRECFNGLPSLDEISSLLAKAVSPVAYSVILENNMGELAAGKYMHVKSLPASVQYKYGIDIEKVLRLFSEGTVNIIFKNLQGQFAALDNLNKELTNELNCTCESQLCLSPASGTASCPRYETADMFILQVSGSRKWKIYQGPIQLPLPSQANQPFELADLPLISECSTEQGDILYIPRGFVYEFLATNEQSLFATVKFTFSTYLRLLLDILKDIGLSTDRLRKTAFIKQTDDLQNVISLLSGKLDEHFNIQTVDHAFSLRRPMPATPIPDREDTQKYILELLTR